MVTNQAVLNKIKAELNQAEAVVDSPEAFKAALSRVQVLCELITSSQEQHQAKAESGPELTEAEKRVMLGEDAEQSESKYHDQAVESIFDF